MLGAPACIGSGAAIATARTPYAQFSLTGAVVDMQT